VGTYAVQLAVNSGAKVTGVCSSSNLEMVRSLGASHVIDYTVEDFTQNGQKYDIIFDCAAKISKSLSKNSLKKDGVYLTVKSPTKELTENLLILKQMAEDGKIRPVIDKSYPLEHIAEAHAYVDVGHKKGNVVVRIA
jgi:NADPH:quinone reductase-like Zn-dependent oxidoreductase